MTNWSITENLIQIRLNRILLTEFVKAYTQAFLVLKYRLIGLRPTSRDKVFPC